MEGSVDAGEFGAWLLQARGALRGSGGSQVPCGDCTGCCTSFYSIEVRPSDAAALDLIPARALFRSQGSAAGNWTVKPNTDGTCPMLQCSRCTIYANRPQTCLDYDCRVFAAAGLSAGGADKAAINHRVSAWRFRFASEADRLAYAAIRAAAAFISGEHALFAPRTVPRNPLGIAALALRVYPIFLPPGPPDDAIATAHAVLESAAAFDQDIKRALA